MENDPWDLPEPPPSPPRQRRRWRLVGGTLVSVALLLAAFVVPIPIFYAYLPGPVRSAHDIVEITDAKTYPSEGKLLLTTVTVDTQVTLAELIAAAFDDNKDIVEAEALTGGRSLEELRELQVAEMAASKQAAREVVLSALGLGSPEGDGVRVEGTISGSAADGVLIEGDLITTIDEQQVQTTCDVIRLMSGHEPGDTITVTTQRGTTIQEHEILAGVDPTDEVTAFIGVSMSDVNYRFDPGLKVRFKTGQIAGPSAGLMFSLALYDRLTPTDLTGGRVIAGTGVISCGGEIGAIGGVEEKIAAAEREGATIFLAPAANAAAAQGAAGDIRVVAISTFDDAVEFLEGLN